MHLALSDDARSSGTGSCGDRDTADTCRPCSSCSWLAVLALLLLVLLVHERVQLPVAVAEVQVVKQCEDLLGVGDLGDSICG